MTKRLATKNPRAARPVDPRWRAVLARDPRRDGAFVYAVRSTGVYCRPSCPARRPGRGQVTFFADFRAAEREGFRACLRCRPGEAGRRDDPAVGLVGRACALLDRALGEDGEGVPTAAALARRLGTGPDRLRRAFRRALGISPRAYADARRWERLRTGLRRGHSVTRTLYDAGFGSPSRVYERTAGHLGMTPGAYRRGGRGMRIGYRVVPSPLGRLLVAATDRGVCAVSLGSSAAVLVGALRREYPAAEIRPGAPGLPRWIRPLLGRLARRGPHPDLPLDVRASAFQWRVWRELLAIPRGRTRSYGEIARSVGMPRGARAVARACATNPVAVLIPCHRAVRADGALGGYRWGLGRKRALLELEKEGETKRRAAPARQ